MSCSAQFCDRRAIIQYLYWVPNALSAILWRVCASAHIHIRYTIHNTVPFAKTHQRSVRKRARETERVRKSERRRRALTACSAWIVIFLFSYVNRRQRHLLQNSLCHLTGLCLSFYFISFICQIIRFFLFQSNHTSSPVVRTHYTDIFNTSTKPFIAFVCCCNNS